MSDPLSQKYPTASRWAFGDAEPLAEKLLGLVRAGVKRATCGAVRHYEEDGDPIPQKGDLSIVTHWGGRPALVIEITDVFICAFQDVPEAFALAEGETSYADWKAAHITYFERNGGFSPDMDVVCEVFEVIEDLEVETST